MLFLLNIQKIKTRSEKYFTTLSSVPGSWHMLDTVALILCQPYNYCDVPPAIYKFIHSSSLECEHLWRRLGCDSFTSASSGLGQTQKSGAGGGGRGLLTITVEKGRYINRKV